MVKALFLLWVLLKFYISIFLDNLFYYRQCKAYEAKFPANPVDFICRYDPVAHAIATGQ
jgi:hypothetical protein